MTKKKTALGLALGGALVMALTLAPTFVQAQANAATTTMAAAADLEHHGGGSRGLIAATASVTGLTEQAVQTELQAGKTLTQIAEANGKTAAAVIAAARTTLQTQLAQAVTDGKLTQADADARLADFDANAASLMTSTTLNQRVEPNRQHGPRTQTDPAVPTTPTTAAPSSNS